MASSLQNQTDAIRSAVSSISTCSPTTTALLKDLVLSASEPRPTKTSRTAGVKTSTTGSRGTKTTTARAGTKEELSSRDKAILATDVVNTGLKALGDAARAATAPPAAAAPQKSQAGELVRRASRNTLRRSLSAPATPLQARSLNRVATSPATGAKPARSASVSSASSTSCLSMVECVRVAFSALKAIHTSGDITLPEHQLEMGVSQLISKQIALSMVDQAVRDLRLLKQWLAEGHGGKTTAATTTTKPTAKRAVKTAQTDSTGSSTRFLDLLDFRDLKPSSKTFGLIVTTQLQGIRILSLMKKPQQTEGAMIFLKDALKLLLAFAESSSSNQGKAARQLETLSQLLFSMAPSVSSKSDDEAMEPRLSVSPTTAFDIQVLGLEARIHWWVLAGHKGDAEKDIMQPFSRSLSAFVRRSQSLDAATYKTCSGAFDRLCSLIQRNATTPLPVAKSFKSPVGNIYQALGAIARETRRFDDAIGWVSQGKGLMRQGDDSEASRCSVAALLLSLYLKDISRQTQGVESLLREVLDNIQGTLRGDSAELDDLLANIGLARRSTMSILVAKAEPDEDKLVSAPVQDLLESLILQCPRFCLRWLGKPPASKGNTKDFLRYEQRRQLLSKSVNHFLDSAFMVIKNLIDEKRISWDVMDSTLAECLVLLDYMGGGGFNPSSSVTSSSESSSTASSGSHFVKISHFYFLQYTHLRQTTREPTKDPEPMRALRRSIECIKHRSAAEKEKASLVSKLERMAEACGSLGRIGEALGALQGIRTSLVDDGVLAGVVRSLTTQPPTLAWTTEPRAAILSRTLVAIAKLEHVPIDWAADLSEQEKLAVLEHRLHFILLGSGGSSKESKRPTLADVCVESLLKTYYPTRFPIRRLRTLLSLLAVNLDDLTEFVAMDSQISAVVGLLESSGDFAGDAPLEGYLRHYRAFHSSLVGLKAASASASPDSPSSEDMMGQLDWAVGEWRALVEATAEEDNQLEKHIDNPSALLTHLHSIADFAHTVGADSTRLATLELSASIVSKLSSSSSSQSTHSAISVEEKMEFDSGLALLYVDIGQSLKAEKVLDGCQKYAREAERPVSGEAVAELHLAYAEVCVLTGSLDKAESHFKQAHTAATSGEAGSRSFKSRRKHLIAYAAILQSIIASKKGETHHALVLARETTRMLHRDWARLEKSLAATTTTTTTCPPKSHTRTGSTTEENEDTSTTSPDTSVNIPAASSSTELTGVSDSEDTSATTTTTTTAGPEFWKLIHPLFRCLFHLSSIYAHLGMFQETVYYAEQARRIAQSTNARLYLAQCDAWLGSIYLKAGKLEKSLELANASSSKLQASDRSCLSVKLACQLGDLYRDLRVSDLGLEMICRAEGTMKLLTLTQEGGDGSNEGLETSLTAGMAKLSMQDKKPATAAKRPTRGKVSTAPVRKATRKATTATAPEPKTALKAVALKPTVPVINDIILSTLKSAVILHRAISFVNKKDWSSALGILHESQALTKLGKSTLLEMVARSACLFGQSQEQMTRHAVFSVIQDSTLSFPAVCGSSSSSTTTGAESERLSLGNATSTSASASKPTPAQKKGRAVTARVESRDARSKEGRLLDFLENLQAAHECLLEAHSVAVVSGDGALVHRIAGMLQSTTLLLSAASPSKPRVLAAIQGFATCSVEAAQNLTWRRERKALMLENSAPRLSEGMDWPPILPPSSLEKGCSPPQSSPVRPRSTSSGSAGVGVGGGSDADAHANMARFQRKYIDVIPRDWTVVSISLSDNGHDLCISRLQAGHSPFVIRLPLERGGSGSPSGSSSGGDDDREAAADGRIEEEVDGDEAAENFNFARGKAELLEVVRLANASCHDARDMSVKGAKTAWWAEREALDRRMARLLENIEQIWLGGFRGIFSQRRPCPELLARFQKTFHNILDKHLPSRKPTARGRRQAKAAAITLDPRILELFIGLGDVTAVMDDDEGSNSGGNDIDDALNDLLYFVVDILQFHGERNAYDEIDFDSMCVETLDALHAYHEATKTAAAAVTTTATSHHHNSKKKASATATATATSATTGPQGSSSNNNHNNPHTILVLDKALHLFPWESLPCMHGMAISRVPSLACLRRLILEAKPSSSSLSPSRSGHHVSPLSGSYILNPEGDLKATQKTFESPLSSSSLSLTSSWPSSSRVVATRPTESLFESCLSSRDILLYFGHGSGAQYVRGRTVRKLKPGCRATVLLWGCSSASLAECGEFEAYGPVWNYLMAGAPAVLGTLWDVTDRDIDRVAAGVLVEWGLVGRGVFEGDGRSPARAGGKKEKEKSKRGEGEGEGEGEESGAMGTASLVQAVARARDVCRFRYLTAAAVCVYGIPVYVDKL